MTAQPPERIFHTRELPTIKGAATRGLFVLTAPTGIGHERDLKLLTADDGVRLDAIRRQPRVRAVAVHPGGSIHPNTALGLVFGEHVRALRAMTKAPVIAPTPQATSTTAGRTRLLHFATLVTGESWHDVVLWEWATVNEATDWFGRPLPAVSWLHHRTEDLLALRRLMRLPVSHPAIAALRDALADRYFSGRFVLEHHELIAAALAHPHLHLDRERVS
jgi:hypothetical protein